MKVDDKPFYRLNFNIHWANTKYTEEAINEIITKRSPRHNVWILPQEFINPDLVEFMKEFGVNNLKAFYFLTPPTCNSRTHVDSTGASDKWALNWAWGSTDHSMTWYTMKEGCSLKDIDTLWTDTSKCNYIAEYRESDVEFLDSTVIDSESPTLIKVGIPHRSENRGNTRRWSVSVRDESILEDSSSDRGWDYIVEKMQKYLT